jgi:DNA polymerase III delta prime subunit
MTNWLNKYSPKSIIEIIGNEIEKQKIGEWLDNYYNKKNQSTSILVLTGSHGIGKTLCAKLISINKKYDILDINLYNSKNQKDTLNLINDITKSNNILNKINKEIDTKYILLINDSDTISNINKSNNKNTNKQLLNLFINNDKYRYFPIILISNGQYSKFMLDIKKYCTTLYFKTPSNSNMIIMLNNIINNEKIHIDLNVKNKIIEFSQNDFRRLINILEDIYNSVGNKKIISINDINKYTFFSKKKNLDIGLIDSTRKLITSYSSILETIKLYHNEKVLLPLMLHDYYIKTIFYKQISPKNIIPTIQKISDSISYADIVETNIYIDQNWYLHDIYGFFSCVKTSYELNKYRAKPIDYTFPIKYSCSDLNKTATKNINKNKLIEISTNDIPAFKNKTLNELFFINKYISLLLQNNNIIRLKQIMKEYNIDLKILEKILKIDKTIKPTIITAKQKKSLSSLE